MIIEVLGYMAVGKSTVSRAVAERLGLPIYDGIGFRGNDGKPMSASRLVTDRVISVMRAGTLSLSATTLYPGSLGRRIGFGVNLARREAIRRRAKYRGGVLDSGPLHALCRSTASRGRDLTSLAVGMGVPDVCILLSVAPEVVVRRFEVRRGSADDVPLAVRAEKVRRYNEAAVRLEGRLGCPVVTIDASEPVQIVVDRVVTAAAAVGESS